MDRTPRGRPAELADREPAQPVHVARFGELIAVIAAGALHVGAELWLSEAIALSLSAGVSGLFVLYVLWRAGTTTGLKHAWGCRRDNFWNALRAQLVFVVPGVIALLGLGAVLGNTPLPTTFWLTLTLYPIWGTAQQFALQNLIARNLMELITHPVGVAVIAAALFGASHYPRLDLVLLTFAAGVPFTLIYQRFPNLWAVGIAHGILGSAAVYSVAGEDPGAAILQLIREL